MSEYSLENLMIIIDRKFTNKQTLTTHKVACRHFFQSLSKAEKKILGL